MKRPKIVTTTELKFRKSIQQSLSLLPRNEALYYRKAQKKIRAYRISYSSSSGVIQGYLVLPRRGKSFPALIYNRGGFKDFGAITDEKVFTQLAPLASWGYAVFASQYPGSWGSEGEDEYGGRDIRDVIALVQIAKNHPKVNSRQMGSIGASRGGLVTYKLLVERLGFRAAVSMAGLADMERQVKLRPEMRSLYRNAFDATTKKYRSRSAVCFAHKFPKDCPVLLLHGSADWRVSVLDSIDLSRLFYRYKVPHRLVVFEGAQHSLAEVRLEAFEMIKDWFARFLKARRSLPNVKLHGP